MHNIKDIRKNSKIFLRLINTRNVNVNIDELLSLDEKNRELINSKEILEQEKKKFLNLKKFPNFLNQKNYLLKLLIWKKNKVNIKKKYYKF